MVFRPWQKYRIKKIEEDNRALRQSGSYDSAENIGIIYFNDDQAKIEDAEKLGTLFKMDGKKVKTIAYEHKNSIKHLPYDTFTKSNFDFWGKFIGKPLQDFASAEFDFLICLDQIPNVSVQSVLAHSQARCRVGRNNEGNQTTFELLFDSPDEGGQWVNNIYQYIKKLS